MSSRGRDLTLRDLGENAVVRELLACLTAGRDVIVGAGDDCAVVGKRTDTTWMLLKTDCVIEGIHFEPTAPARKIGWKAMARALSDIAAMAGTPRHALVTVAAPPTMRCSRLKDIYRGLDDAAAKHGASIVGGETARSQGPLFLSITLTGEVGGSRCILRSGGRNGDALYVTGRLGGSIRGRHLTFEPRLREARWLAKNFPVHAMMDLSDGIAADLPRLAAASGCGFSLDDRSLPRHRGVNVQSAVTDGEDYELLFSIPPTSCAAMERRWQKQFPNLLLTRIGALNSRRSHLDSTTGHDHFK